MNVLEAEAFLQSYPNVILRSVYDDDEKMREALGVLFKNFEYPDFDYMTVKEIYRKHMTESWFRDQKTPERMST